jgi:hypothetical protein
MQFTKRTWGHQRIPELMECRQWKTKQSNHITKAGTDLSNSKWEESARLKAKGTVHNHSTLVDKAWS